MTESALVTALWPDHQHLNFGEIHQVARASLSAASDKAHELTKAKFASLGRKPKIDFDNVRLQAITCGIMDQSTGQCMYGTHHAVVNGRTLCGQSGQIAEPAAKEIAEGLRKLGHEIEIGPMEG